MSLLRLPAQLIYRIYYFLDPGSHFDFSLTNRQTTYNSRDVLAYHRKCDSLYGSGCSDRDLATFDTLLEDVVRDQVVAWHLRNFEICDSTDEDLDEDSRLLGDDDGDPNDAKQDLDITIPAIDLLRSRLRIADVDVDHQMQEFYRLLQAGTREMRQVLLFASCPRMKSIKFSRFPTMPPENTAAQRFRDAVAVARDIGLPGYTVGQGHFFGNTITILNRISDVSWPPGFYALRKIALLGEGRAAFGPKSVAPMFLLPSVQSIYIRGLGSDDRINDLDYSFDGLLSPRSSSVQHLLLEGATGYQNWTWEALSVFIASAKDPKSLIFMDCNLHDTARVVKYVAMHREATLERLIFYRGEWLDSDALRLENYHIDDIANTQIKVLTLDMHDVIRASRRIGNIRYGYGRPNLFGSDYERFLTYFASSVPHTVETIILNTSRTIIRQLTEVAIQVVDGALARLVDTRRCPNLGIIYLECGQDYIWRYRHRWSTPGYNRPFVPASCFPRTMACSKEQGVEVIVRDDEASTDGFFNELCDGHFDVTPIAGAGSSTESDW